MRILLFLLIVVNAITMSNPAYAASIWDKRKQAVQDMKEKAQKPKVAEPAYDYEEKIDTAFDTSLDPEDIIIPDQYGTIIETHRGTNGKLIIHIQDAHANYEGQMNSAKIIESLIEDYDLNLILGEGHINDGDYKYLRDRASLEDRIEVADGLVRDGYFTGINYLDLATDYATKIQGLEDKTLYDAHVDSLWEIDKFKDMAGEYVEELIVVSDLVKPHIYNEDLLDLDNRKKDYDSEKIDLLEYYEFLYRKAGEQDIPLYVFPNFKNLIKASELEKKIDLAKVRDGSATDEEMTLYNEYLEATRDLKINELFKEGPLLEDAVQDTVAVNYDQKKLLRISKALSIMKNFLKIKVVPEEYKYFIDNKRDFDPRFWADFLREKSEELSISAGVPDNHYIISDNLAKVEKFYGIANERDRVFLKKTNEHLEREDVDLAVLVAGGFHTPALTDLLADAGYSYIVVSPKVTTETDNELYRWALKMDWTE